MNIIKDRVKDSHIFNVINDDAANYIYIKAIGYEIQEASQSKPYYWDCNANEKANINDMACIFQYTVSGEGAIEINNRTYRLGPGSIFMIERPGPYKYWLPKDSGHWELKFVELSRNSLYIWNTITKAFGHIFSMNESDSILQLWNQLFADTKEGKIKTIFDNSIYAYTFLLTIHKYLAEFGAKSKSFDAIQACIDFINENFARNITITDIASAGKISPFYLNKTFKDMLGETPMNYVSKVRIRYSMALLYNSDLSIEEISENSGFQSSNYFSKVFRKYISMSPTEFRNQHIAPIIL